MTRSTRLSYDRVADRYVAEIGDELADRPVDRALLAALAELANGPVFDLGAGPGHIATYLTERGTPAVSADLSPSMCWIAQQAGLPTVVADLVDLPIASESIGGIVCFYAVIHLDDDQRRRAYAEFQRVLRPGGAALISFHTSDADIPVGGEHTMREWWGQDVDLTFRYLDPDAEVTALTSAGLELLARTDREPDVREHPSKRSYLLVRRR